MPFDGSLPGGGGWSLFVTVEAPAALRTPSLPVFDLDLLLIHPLGSSSPLQESTKGAHDEYQWWGAFDLILWMGLDDCQRLRAAVVAARGADQELRLRVVSLSPDQSQSQAFVLGVPVGTSASVRRCDEDWVVELVTSCPGR